MVSINILIYDMSITNLHEVNRESTLKGWLKVNVTNGKKETNKQMNKQQKQTKGYLQIKYSEGYSITLVKLLTKNAYVQSNPKEESDKATCYSTV